MTETTEGLPITGLPPGVTAPFDAQREIDALKAAMAKLAEEVRAPRATDFEIGRLTLGPDDVLVVRTQDAASVDTAEQIVAYVREVLNQPLLPVLVIGREAEITAASIESSAIGELLAELNKLKIDIAERSSGTDAALAIEAVRERVRTMEMRLRHM